MMVIDYQGGGYVIVIDYQDGGHVMVIIPKEMETMDKVERLEKEVERLRSVEVEVTNNFDQQCLAFHNNLQNKGTSLTDISTAVILTLLLENPTRCGPDCEERRKKWHGLNR